MRRTDSAPRRRRPAVKIETAPGAYATVPVWQTREAFLASVGEAGAAFRSDRRRSLRAVAEALAGYAEHRTGRDVAVSVERLARAAGVVARTVYRRLADLRDAGLLVTVDGGRHLTRAERERTGRFRKASTRALTHAPREVSPHPETEGLTGNLTSPSITKRARRAAKTASNSKTDRKPRTLRVQRLAAAVDRRLPYLVRDRHVGALAAVLQAEGVEEWTASDVVEAVDAWHARHGWKALATEARDALAWFAAALRRARQEGAESRTAASRAAQEAARLRAAERAREHAEEDARAARAAASPEVAAACLGVRLAIAAAKRAVGVTVSPSRPAPCPFRGAENAL